jgi:hypothetical protein
LALIFFGFVRDDPLHPRHQRSIDTFFSVLLIRSLPKTIKAGRRIANFIGLKKCGAEAPTQKIGNAFDISFKRRWS